MGATDDETPVVKVMVEPPVVKVTLDRVYEILLGLDRTLGPLPGLVADHEARIRHHEGDWIGRKETELKIEHVENRTASLERSTAMLAGVKGVLALVVAAGGSATISHFLR